MPTNARKRNRGKSRARFTTTKKILLAIGVLVATALAVGAVVVLVGGRTYVATTKTTEARNVLREIARLAVASYDAGRLCPSASFAIPTDRARIRGVRYLPSRAEWEIDQRSNAGFACLGFWMDQPQYYQYEYEATTTGFVARAYGDLDGNGVFSKFEIRGDAVTSSSSFKTRMQVSPISEIDPLE